MNRFLWVVGGDARRLRLAALCQFTLPDPPIVYYGTEVGLSQRRDVRYADGSGHPEESRLPMPWGDGRTPSLLAFYVEPRRGCGGATAACGARPREVVALDDEAGLYAWRCDDGCGRRRWSRSTTAMARWPVEVDPSAGWALGLASADGVRLAAGRLVLPPVAGRSSSGAPRPAPASGARRIEAR